MLIDSNMCGSNVICVCIDQSISGKKKIFECHNLENIILIEDLQKRCSNGVYIWIEHLAPLNENSCLPLMNKSKRPPKKCPLHKHLPSPTTARC